MSITHQFKPVSIKPGTTLTSDTVQQIVKEAIEIEPADPIEITVSEDVANSPWMKSMEEAGIARRVGRPSSGKVVTTLRLDPEVIDALKAAGPGWQARANALLRTALKL